MSGSETSAAMTEDERIRVITVGLVRAMNPDQAQGMTDDEAWYMYQGTAGALARALHTVLVDLVRAESGGV